MITNYNTIKKKTKNGCLNKLASLALSSTAIISATLPAQALTINFTYDTGVTYEQKVAAELVSRYWSDHLLDDGTVNIHLTMASASKLPSNVLGGAIPAFNSYNYTNFVTNLSNDRISANDFTALANLPGHQGSGTWGAWVEAPWVSSDKISLTRANAKALNLINKNSTALDGIILLSDLSNISPTWQYDYLSTSVGSTRFDYTTVLMHEVGHILGFVSGLDAVTVNNFTNTTERVNYITPFDLFRRSNFTTGLEGVDLGYGETTFFSINGGITNLGNLSTGSNSSINQYYTTYGTPDGFQTSHWKRNGTTVLGIMDPALGLGVRRQVSSLDLTALDVTGWNIDARQNSFSTLKTQAQQAASTKGNSTNATLIGEMFNQNRWGGGSSGGGFGQVQDLTTFLTQQGFFEIGTLWSKIPDDIASVPEPATNMGLIGVGLFAVGALKKRHLKSQA